MDYGYTTRVDRVLALAEQIEVDAFLLTSPVNVRYLTGFTGSNGTVFLSPHVRELITDQRYVAQAEREAPGWTIRRHPLDRDASIPGMIAGHRASSVGFEDASLTVNRFLHLSNQLNTIRWEPIGDGLTTIRAIKTPAEIDAIRRSASVAVAAFSDVLDRFAAGAAERDIAASLTYSAATRGADGDAFEPIVASGPNAAYPHAHPTDRHVAVDDVVTIDWGARLAGYHSDLTRVVRRGRPTDAQLNLVARTEEALLAALDAAKPGITCSELDEVARSVFRRAGVEESSLRGLGHGVGLEIHEYPRVVMGNQAPLRAGMVFTIEPGLYVPGIGGARIEELVAISDDGAEVLTTGIPRVVEV